MDKNAVITIIKKYMVTLEEFGIHSERTILFGSFATGKADKWSDIDIIVIAPEFDTDHSIQTAKKLWRATKYSDNRIEPIPCGVKEWEEDCGRPIIDIARREGVEIEV